MILRMKGKKIFAYMGKKELAATNYKYNINVRLMSMESPKRFKIRNAIMEKASVTGSTYHRWLHLDMDDKADIPGAVLIHFAKLLRVSASKLLNERPGK
jgi:NADH:ubiquinone oxidoreductase subunit